MNTPHYGQHERREGLGGRVRRFVDTELNRVLDKDNRGAGHPGDPDPAGRGGVVDRAYEADSVQETPVQETPVQETQRAHELDQGTYSEPVTSYPAAPSTDQPATTPTHDVGRTHDAGREPLLQPTRPEEFRGQSGDQLAAEGSAARVGLLNDVASLRDEWQQVQGTFVDDPQRAVHEASVLVDRTLDEIRVNVGSERPSETMSTEDLRVSFQRYREFFQRLLSA